MFRPTRMKLFSIFTLKENFDKVVKELANAESIHVEKSKKFVGQRNTLVKKTDSERMLSKARGLLKGIEEVIGMLGITSREVQIDTEELEVGSSKAIENVEKDFNKVETKIKTLFEKLEGSKTELKNKQKFSWLLPLLKELGINIFSVREYKHIKLRCGIVPSNKIAPLRKSLKNVSYELKVGKYLKNNVLICIITETENVKVLEKALRGINFKRINLTSVIEEFSNGNDSYSMDRLFSDIEYGMWIRREKIADIKKQIKNLKKEMKNKLLRWRAKLRVNINIMEAMGNFLETKYGYCISGWVPSKQVSKLRNELSTICGKRIKIEIHSPDKLKNLDIKIPTKFENPSIFKPFQKLVTTYGIPKYNSIDPTIIVGLSFVGMFGVMFGDVGHGGVLFLLGILPFLFRKLKKLKEFGAILLSCGISSMIFGFLFGSIFGLEDIIPAIWFRPLESPLYFLKIGIFIGIGMVSLGIVLNIVQNLTKGNTTETLFGQWGVFSSIFYWLCLGMGWKVMHTGEINISMPLTITLLLIPLLAITFGDIIVSKIRKKDLELAETIFKPIELMLGILTNTISYVRVAAFGLTHAALMVTLFTIVGFIGNGMAGFKESIVVEGNIGIILLEGLIVFIQVLRLEYYEFFSKFFQAEGKLFRPLKLTYSSN